MSPPFPLTGAFGMPLLCSSVLVLVNPSLGSSPLAMAKHSLTSEFVGSRDCSLPRGCDVHGSEVETRGVGQDVSGSGAVALGGVVQRGSGMAVQNQVFPTTHRGPWRSPLQHNRMHLMAIGRGVATLHDGHWMSKKKHDSRLRSPLAQQRATVV